MILPVQPSTGRSRPVPGESVRLDGGFWGARQSLNARVLLDHCDAWVTKMGWLDSFAAAARGALDSRQGKLFTDADVYKLVEALAWEQGRAPEPGRAERIEALARLVADAQADDGYLNTYFGPRGERYRDLAHGHELYCAGHLFQAAVARLRTHGEDELTRAAIRFADRICTDFAGGDGIDGHPEVEVGLVELFRATGHRRYLDQAARFIELRGHQRLEPHAIGHEYYQDDLPVRDAKVFRGHVVRALYLAAATVDVAVETGDPELLDAVVAQWDATWARRTYLTGGMGSRHLGESFGGDFELPPDRAYTETCGAVAAVMVAWRLLLATGQVRFADAIERLLYNMVATSPSVDGDRFFYVNPLLRREPGIEVPDGVAPFRKDTLRANWFWVSCCPTNLVRLLATLPAYLASATDDGVYLHQYATGTVAVGSGRLRVTTGYPWDGRIRVQVEQAPPGEWALHLRVPAWAETGATLSVGRAGEAGGAVREPVAPGYATARRRWQPGDEVILELPMAPRFTYPDPRVDALRGTVAVERGPLVYCFEALAGGIDEVAVDPAAPLSAQPATGLGDVAVQVRAVGRRLRLPDPQSWPYRGSVEVAAGEPVELPLVPYYAWANRGPSTMRVWIPSY